MADEIDVYLISGFLGAGKTTLLNRLVKVVPPDLRFLILMNEFGDIGLDGTLVEGEDLDMLEISKDLSSARASRPTSSRACTR